MKRTRKKFDERKLVLKKGVLRVDLEKGASERIQDEVVVESEFRLFINNEPSTVFTCSPSKIRELVIGHLVTQRIIHSPEEVELIKFDKKKIAVRLMRKKDTDMNKEKRANNSQESQSIEINSETILNAAKMLDTRALVFKKTGGTHSAAILNSRGEPVVFSEDVGRHNAVDKVVGEAALKRINMKRMVLALTGRLSSEIVTKAANAGIPVVISLAASTDKGIDVAQKRGLTLIGFVRGRRFNVYSHTERLSL
jgi:FdhD protein